MYEFGEVNIQKFFESKSILITGACGTIGKNLARQLLGYKLKDPDEEIEAKKVYGLYPDEPFVKADKPEYRDKKSGEIVRGEPASIDAKRK